MSKKAPKELTPEQRENNRLRNQRKRQRRAARKAEQAASAIHRKAVQEPRETIADYYLNRAIDEGRGSDWTVYDFD